MNVKVVNVTKDVFQQDASSVPIVYSSKNHEVIRKE